MAAAAASCRNVAAVSLVSSARQSRQANSAAPLDIDWARQSRQAEQYAAQTQQGSLFFGRCGVRRPIATMLCCAQVAVHFVVDWVALQKPRGELT